MGELVHGLIILPFNSNRFKSGLTQAALGHKVCWATILLQTNDFQITYNKIINLKIAFFRIVYKVSKFKVIFIV